MVAPINLGDIEPTSGPGTIHVGEYDCEYIDVGIGGVASSSDRMKCVMTTGAVLNDASAIVFNGGVTGSAVNPNLPFLPVANSRLWVGAELEVSNSANLLVWVGIGITVAIGSFASQANFAAVNVRGAAVAPRMQTNNGGAGVESTTITSDDTSADDTKFTMGFIIDGTTSMRGYFNGHVADHVQSNGLPVGARMTLQVYGFNAVGPAGGGITVHRLYAAQEMV